MGFSPRRSTISGFGGQAEARRGSNKKPTVNPKKFFAELKWRNVCNNLPFSVTAKGN